MTSLQPWWWAALPVLLLPLWWHRQKRQRTAAELLATAHFLPSSAPQQRRIWRWTEVLLLIVRLALLVALIAWLAVTVFPWRGNTVLVATGLDPAWVEREVVATRMQDASRIALPPHVLDWLHRNEHTWRDDARILVLAHSGDVPMPAHPPQFGHGVTFRLAPAAPPTPRVHHVVLATQDARWRALFAAFGAAGERYEIAAAPTAQTELIVWDRPEAPPSGWKAPHWWRSGGTGKQVRAAGLQLTYADTPQGRIWSGMPWPTASAADAAALHDAWQALAVTPLPYPLPALETTPVRTSSAAADGTRALWWPWLLLGLFILERLLAHARRT
jgi:hypothetical protein